MTNELLKLINIPEIQNKRGEWQVNDSFYHIELDEAFITNISPNKFLHYTTIDGHITGGVGPYNYKNFVNDMIWLPQFYNNNNPKRSLFGMITCRIYGIVPCCCDHYIIKTDIANFSGRSIMESVLLVLNKQGEQNG